MKIVYISNSIIPSRSANSIHVMKMCNAFSKINNDVTLLAPDKNGNENKVSDVFSYYNVDKKFTIEFLSAFNIKGWSYIYSWLSAKRAMEIPFDFIISRNVMACFFLSLFGKDFILEVHSPVEFESKIRGFFFRSLIKRKSLKKLVVITDALKRFYEKKYPVLKNKIYLASDAADPIPEDIESISIGSSSNRLKVGYVGHLYPGKGMEVISELALKTQDWAEFHIVGGTQEDIDFWRGKCSSINNINFHGYIPHQYTHSYIQAFDVVLLPNQEIVRTNSGGKLDIGKWTSPLKAFEYMANCKAIISSDLPVLREIFRNRENSLLCQPDKIEDWVFALRELRDDLFLRELIANKAYEEFLKLYSWSARARNILSLY